METYQGMVRSPQDAIILFEACRIGLLPRVQRRLSEKERQQIKSGSVFVWDEREAGMRRWTDGKSWSASRVAGSFLTYREMEGKRGGTDYQTPPAVRRANDVKSAGSSINGDSDGEEGPGGGYRYKPDGLMKQSFSITTNDSRHLHLISYYARQHHESLKLPSQDHTLRNIQPPKGMYPEAAVNESSAIPPVTRGPMASSPYPSAPPPHPHPQMVVAYHPGYPQGPPIAYPYPPQNWGPSPPSGQQIHYAYYPPPGYYTSPPHLSPHYPPYPYAQHAPSPQPHTTLPPLHHVSGPPHPPGQPSPRQYAGPGYPPSSQPPPSQHRGSYGGAEETRSFATQAQTNGATLAPVINGHKPPTPPPSTTPQSKDFPEPAPIREVPKGSTPPSKTIIPSISALINGQSHDSADSREEKAPSRAGSKSPQNPRALRDVPDAMAAGGLQRDKNDLKRLDSQLLKSL